MHQNILPGLACLADVLINTCVFTESLMLDSCERCPSVPLRMTDELLPACLYLCHTDSCGGAADSVSALTWLCLWLVNIVQSRRL